MLTDNLLFAAVIDAERICKCRATVTLAARQAVARRGAGWQGRCLNLIRAHLVRSIWTGPIRHRVRIRFRTLRTEAIHHECGVAGGTLSPPSQLMPKVGRRCLRRDVDGPIRRLTWQRPAPGWRARMARDPGGPLRPLPPRRPAMEPVCSDRPEGSRCERRCRPTGRGGKPKHRSGAQNRRTRVPQGSPGPEQGLREPDGVPRKARNRRLPGRMVPAPGLPMRHPRTRRTLAGNSCGGGRRVVASITTKGLTMSAQGLAKRRL
jgi:hypothetical protein